MESILCPFLTGIVGREGDSRETYKVMMVVGEPRRQKVQKLEISDFSEKSWKIHSPQDVHIEGDEMVLGHGSFYYLMVNIGGLGLFITC